MSSFCCHISMHSQSTDQIQNVIQLRNIVIRINDLIRVMNALASHSHRICVCIRWFYSLSLARAASIIVSSGFRLSICPIERYRMISFSLRLHHFASRSFPSFTFPPISLLHLSLLFSSVLFLLFFLPSSLLLFHSSPLKPNLSYPHAHSHSPPIRLGQSTKKEHQTLKLSLDCPFWIDCCNARSAMLLLINKLSLNWHEWYEISFQSGFKRWPQT